MRGRDAAQISTGEDNLIWRTALAVAADVGDTLPPIALEIDNDIPLGKGLGSSAAALTAGVVIADHLLGLHWKPHRILDEAAKIEGHPDNVAACVSGFHRRQRHRCGRRRCARFVLRCPRATAWRSWFRTLCCPLRESRNVLPASYSKSDAVFNVQRSALLIAALATGATSAFPAALEDRMHQPYRYALVPGLEEMVKLRAPGLLGCALSGAGPSILVFYERGYEQVCDLVRQIFAFHGHSSETLCVPIARDGCQLS